VAVLELDSTVHLVPLRRARENRAAFDVADAVHDAHAMLRVHGKAGTQFVADCAARRKVDRRERAVQVLCESKTLALGVCELDAGKAVCLT